MVRAGYGRLSYFELFSALESQAINLAEGSVAAIHSEMPSFLVGRDRQGRAYVLIEPIDHKASSHINYRLAEVEARLFFAARVQLAGEVYSSDFALIKCWAADTLTLRYFFGVCESMAGILGPSPASTTVGDSINRIMRIFSRIESRSKTSVIGMLGELVFILAHPSPVAAVRAWHSVATEKFDFVFQNLRLDVKATTLYERRHHLSLEQIEVRGDTQVVFASILLDVNSSGASGWDITKQLVELCGSDLAAAVKLQEVVADHLGDNLTEFFECRIDLASAISSLNLYDSRDIPRLSGELPAGVSSVQFVSDFSIAPTLPLRRVMENSTSYRLQ